MKRKKRRDRRDEDRPGPPGPGEPDGRRDEPRAEGDGWVAWGGQLMLEIGTTEGGAPYGLTVEEFRRANESSDRRPGWATAKRVLREALPREPSGPYKGGREDEDIGWVRHLGSGLSYDAYYAECHVQRGPASESASLVVRLPRRHAPAGLAERSLRELRVLQHLGTQQVPLRLPRVLGAVPTTCGLAFVQEAVFWTATTTARAAASRCARFASTSFA